jgi:hypothetical protein
MVIMPVQATSKEENSLSILHFINPNNSKVNLLYLKRSQQPLHLISKAKDSSNNPELGRAASYSSTLQGTTIPIPQAAVLTTTTTSHTTTSIPPTKTNRLTISLTIE